MSARAISALAIFALLVGGVLGTAAPSYADSTVVVPGTAFPEPARASLAVLGCEELTQRTEERLVPRIAAEPEPVVGNRSLWWDPAGGNAVGVLFPVASMASTSTASLAIWAEGRAAGVAYAGYQEPADAGTALLWLGRAELGVGGGAWQSVEATGEQFRWTKYDMATGQPLDGAVEGPATVRAFIEAHGGDGPGLYAIGFGCDGSPFSMDRARIGAGNGVPTYDIEALRTSVEIGHRLTAGGKVTITGRLSTSTGDPLPHATMILERRVGRGEWENVLVADVVDGQATAVVALEPRLVQYRWRFVERPLAEGSTSSTLQLIPARAPVPPPSAPSSKAPDPDAPDSEAPAPEAPAPEAPAPEELAPSTPGDTAGAADGPAWEPGG